MPDPRGFIKVPRATPPERDPAERVHDYGEIYKVLPEPELKRQASRCMGCGVPFCNDACPLGNLIPDWNDLVRTGRWREAIDQLHATNNFPEFTGLVCPAPCESACVLDINDEAGDDQADRVRDRRERLGGGLDQAEPARVADRPDGRRDRLGPGGPRRRAGAERRRPRGDGLRARRGARRPDPLRRAGREAREVDHRPPRAPARWPRRASTSPTASTSAARRCRRTSCATATTPW